MNYSAVCEYFKPIPSNAVFYVACARRQPCPQNSDPLASLKWTNTVLLKSLLAAGAVAEDSKDNSGVVTSTDSFVAASKSLRASNDVITRSTSGSRLADVECHLDLKELWDKFHQLGTEMIITKSGRCVCVRDIAFSVKCCTIVIHCRCRSSEV